MGNNGRMPAVSIRTATPADAAAIVAVKRAAINELAPAAYSPAELDAWAPDDEAIAEFRSALGADAFQVLVAEDDDRIVGYSVLNAAEEAVDALFVRPFWSRIGIATRLLAQLETSAAFAGCPTLSATVSLNAVPFYEAAGYRRVETRWRSIDGVELEFVFMRKELRER